MTGALLACSCDDGAKSSSVWWRILVSAFLAVNSMTFGLAVNTSEVTDSERLALQGGTLVATAIVTVLLGWPLLTASLTALLQRRITIEALFVLSYLGAMVASTI